MSEFRYRAVPFIGKLRSGRSADEVAQQLETLINSIASEGWEFIDLRNTNIEVKPGCLSALFGAKNSYIRYDMVIFRRPIG